MHNNKQMRDRLKKGSTTTACFGIADRQDVATPSSSRGTNDSWEAYVSMVHLVQGKVRIPKKAVTDPGELDIAPALQYLTCQEEILETPVLGTDFEKTLYDQRAAFMMKTNLTPFQYDYAMKILAYIGDFCAKKQDPRPLTIAWRKLMESGVSPRENTISTYMYALSLDESTSQMCGQAATFHDLLFEPNEKTIALRIKSLISSGDAVGAELLLQRLPNNDWTRLRTYLPILMHYRDKSDLSSVLRLHRQMKQAPGVHFDAETYAVVIGMIAENGGFRRDAAPIHVALDLGYTSTHGPRLLDELLQEMADDILELNVASVRVLYNAFVEGFKNCLPSSGEPLLNDGADLSVCNDPASENEFILSRVTVNKTTGVCPRSREKLQLFQLDAASRLHVQETLQSMAKDQFAEFQLKATDKSFKTPNSTKQKKAVEEYDSDYPVVELQNFAAWLKGRDRHFTAIVDGANIAYFGHGIVKYSQIQHVVTKLEAMNERPLVVMPFKYLQPRFYASIGKVQNLSERDFAVIDRLDLEGKLYRVPPKCLDDYYWMMASIVGQDDTVVNAEGQEGRFPGIRPMLITNDQMRDHKLELLEPRLFRRWCSCHVVNYSFPDSYSDEWDERPLDFYPADVFSREIQGNPSAFTADQHPVGSLCWHFPVSEWDDHELFCLRI